MGFFWYTKKTADIFEILKTNDTGLRSRQAVRRLQKDGYNTLPAPKSDGIVIIFLHQFQSSLIYLLLVASVAVFLFGETTDGFIILAVLIFNAIIGAIQEGRAQNTLLALRQYLETSATVLRDKKEIVIPDKEVVRGDILILREGEKVSADARIVYSNGLRVAEASLTGESEPVYKTSEVISQKDTPVTGQYNLVFKGTNIVTGDAKAVVVATGTHSVIGGIAKEISAIDTEIPLKKNIQELSRIIIMAVGVISALIIVLGLVEGKNIITIFATVVSLAVSIIPEGLPIVITLVLATGVWRMSKRNALVKKLQAVEALGQARIIAVDKTGTITKNELVTREVWTDNKTFSISGIGYEPSGSVAIDGLDVDIANNPELLLVGKISALSANARVFFSEENNSWKVVGDPTEAAIRVFGEKIGFKKDDVLRKYPKISEMPFDYNLKYQASVFSVSKGDLLVVSGAPEKVLALCTQMRREGKNHSMRVSDRKEIENKLMDMSGRALRVVAIATRERFSEQLSVDTAKGLTFVSFIGMQDTIRPEVPEAMARATYANIKVVMVTGDYELTARSIAKEANIWHEGDDLLTGAEIDNMSDRELKVRVANVSVFARVTPEHKLRIINTYKQRGEIVAMTGDGVNDAPSLVAADLGVAMGKTGTEVAKESADIILLDDNFGSIISAVEEGRGIYKTIKKVLLYLFSTSLGEVLTIVGALILGYPLPLLAAQIIWLNFVTDGFLDVALAMEPKEKGLLSKTFKRPNKYLVDKLMIQRMTLMAIPMVLGTLFLFQKYAGTDMGKAWTMSLTTLAVFQWFNAWNCRSEEVSFFRSGLFSNKFLLATTGLVIVLQMLAVYNPFFQRVLLTVPLGISDWLMIIFIATSVIFVEETRKFFYRRNKSTHKTKQIIFGKHIKTVN